MLMNRTTELFSNVCMKKCATPLYLKSIQSGHEVKYIYSMNDKMFLKNFMWSGNPSSVVIQTPYW